MDYNKITDDETFIAEINKLSLNEITDELQAYKYAHWLLGTMSVTIIVLVLAFTNLVTVVLGALSVYFLASVSVLADSMHTLLIARANVLKSKGK